MWLIFSEGGSSEALKASGQKRDLQGTDEAIGEVMVTQPQGGS